MKRHSTTIRTPGRRAPKRRGLAFTLVELLVVISILILLVSLLVPAFQRVKEAVYRTRSQKRINELAAGCVRYAQDNKGLYPGQAWVNSSNQLISSGGTQKALSGAQVLAQAMFGLQDSDFNNGATNPPTDGNSIYASYSPGDDMMNFGGPSGTVYNCIWDQYSTTNKMPLLYYPARLGMPATLGSDSTCQYQSGDNSGITGSNFSSWLGGSFNGGTGYIADRRLSPNGGGNYPSACNPGTFLIIGASTDANYGTVDDLKNFGN